MAMGWGALCFKTTTLVLCMSFPLAAGLAKPKAANERNGTGVDTYMKQNKLIASTPRHAVSLLSSRTTSDEGTASRCICDYTVGGRKRKHRRNNCVCKGSRTSRGEENNRDLPFPEQMDIPPEDGDGEGADPPHAEADPYDDRGYYQNDGWLPPRERGSHYRGPLGVTRSLSHSRENGYQNYPQARRMPRSYWQSPLWQWPQWQLPPPQRNHHDETDQSPPEEQLPPEPDDDQVSPELANDPLSPLLEDEDFPFLPQFLPQQKKNVQGPFNIASMKKYSPKIRIPVNSEDVSSGETYKVGKPVERNKQLWVPLIPVEHNMSKKTHKQSHYDREADIRQQMMYPQDMYEGEPYPRPQPLRADPYMNPYVQSAYPLPSPEYPYPPPPYMSRNYIAASRPR